ncbi:MAG: GIY-YIG nuclease family protein [Gemmatimonadaceae bacterium]
MAKKFTDEDDELLDELGVEVEAEKSSTHSAKEERIIAGFEEIQRWVDEHGRTPRHGETGDIFERLYAVRLDRIRVLPDCRTLVEPMDRQELLTADATSAVDAVANLDDDALLAELGVETASVGDITELRHVRSVADKRAAEEIANREKCEDFEQFRPVFEKVQRELDNGARATRRFERKSEIEQGRFYILSGQKAYVASMGESYINESGNRDARLRVIFDNGTESNLLMRSLQKALQQDPSGRRVTEESLGPLFGGDRVKDHAGTPSGTIYVLRSNLDHPFVNANREILHKIGVTGNDVDRRVGDTMVDPTYLMGEVETVAVYHLFDLNRTKLEALIHRLFASARVDIEIPDRFGNMVRPKEWYLVPLFVIDEAIERFQDGSIVNFAYDHHAARMVQVVARG